jgi:integrase
VSVYIVARTTTSGDRRFHVRYSPGKYQPLLHLGSFKARKLAEKCRDWAEHELAEGRVPDRRLLLRNASVLEERTLASYADEWIASRVDVTPYTREKYAATIRQSKAAAIWSLTPAKAQPSDVQAFIRLLERRSLKPSTIRHYVDHLRAVLDYAGIEPNPARHVRVKLPRMVNEAPDPPSHDDVVKILNELRPSLRVPVALLEACGLRVSEACALAWGSVHPGELIVEKGKTTRARRSVPLPDDFVPLLGDRGSKADKVFPGLNRGIIANNVRRASARAGITIYSPHDLRHRAISRWVLLGENILEVQRRAGHSRASITLDVYSHVRCDTREAWRVLLEH